MCACYAITLGRQMTLCWVSTFWELLEDYKNCALFSTHSSKTKLKVLFLLLIRKFTRTHCGGRIWVPRVWCILLLLYYFVGIIFRAALLFTDKNFHIRVTSLNAISMHLWKFMKKGTNASCLIYNKSVKLFINFDNELIDWCMALQ